MLPFYVNKLCKMVGQVKGTTWASTNFTLIRVMYRNVRSANCRFPLGLSPPHHNFKPARILFYDEAGVMFLHIFWALKNVFQKGNRSLGCSTDK